MIAITLLSLGGALRLPRADASGSLPAFCRAVKEGWLEFAAEWTKLAREKEAKAKPVESEMPAGESFSEG